MLGCGALHRCVRLCLSLWQRVELAEAKRLNHPGQVLSRGERSEQAFDRRRRLRAVSDPIARVLEEPASYRNREAYGHGWFGENKPAAAIARLSAQEELQNRLQVAPRIGTHLDANSAHDHLHAPAVFGCSSPSHGDLPRARAGRDQGVIITDLTT